MLFIVIFFAAGLRMAEFFFEFRTLASTLWPLISLFAIFGYKKFNRAALVAALLAFYFAGVAVGANLYHEGALIAESCTEAHPVRIDARVIDVPLETNKYLKDARRGGVIIEFDQPLASGERIKTRAIVYFNEDENIGLLPNDKIQLIGTMARPRAKTLPGIYDRPKSLARFGIHLQISGASIEQRIPASWYSPLSLAAKLRSRGARIFRNSLKPRVAEIFVALVLGYRYGVNQHDRAIFTESGLGHLFAVSGLHVAILAFMVGFLLRALGIGTKKRAVILGVFVIFYAIMVGARPPVVRATVMILTYLTATLIGRGRDTINTISFAAFVLLVYSPLWHSDPGFLLSFAAVGCIVLMFPVLEELWAEYRKSDVRLEIRFERKWKHALQDWFRHAIFVSLAAQIGVQPLLIHFMGFFNPWGVLANVLVLPLAAVVLAMGVLMLCVGLIASMLAGIFASLATAVLMFLLMIADILSLLPGSIIYVSLTEANSLLIFYSLLLYVLLGAHTRVRDIWDEEPTPLDKKAIGYGVGFGLASLLIGAIAASMSFKARPESSLTVIESGHAHSFLINSHDGHKLLFGAGSPGSGKFLAGKLMALGAQSLDAVVIPKDNATYTKGLTHTIKIFKPSTLLLPKRTKSNESYSENILMAASKTEANNGTVLWPSNGDKLQLTGEVIFEKKLIKRDDGHAALYLWREVNTSIGIYEFMGTDSEPSGVAETISPIDVLVITPPSRAFNRGGDFVRGAVKILTETNEMLRPKIIILAIDKTTQNTLWGERVIEEFNASKVPYVLPKDGGAVSVINKNNKFIVEASVDGRWMQILP